MLVPVEVLIDGVVRTLTEAVLPDVESRVARAQLYAVVDVLRNLRDRVEEKAALAEAEAASAEHALARAAAALAPVEAGRIAAALEAVPAGPLAARVAALGAALVAALETVPPGPARAALESHLTAQAMRDVAVLKPSLLGEISKG